MMDEYDFDSAMDYLITGGLGEVIIFTDFARAHQEPKVQMDTDMAMAVLVLAGEALDARNRSKAH